MNWVNSSLQLAGTLLESVDQHAAMTLAGGDVDDTLSDSERDVDAHSLSLAKDKRSAATSADALGDSSHSLTGSSSGLKTELRAREKQLAAAQRSLAIVEQEMEALEKECAQKLSELQAELAQLRADKDADEKNFVQALELKEAQVQAVRAELERLEQRAAQQATETEALRSELARVEESKDAVWTHAASETQQSAQVVEALRTELREAQSSLATAKRELADSKVAMFARQSQLEKTNAELSTTVAALERELAKMRETGAAASGVGGAGDAALLSSHVHATAASTQLQEDYRKVQHALVLAKKALHEETRKLELQRQETARLSEELKRLKDDATAGESETARQLLAATRENEQLAERLRAVQAETARSTAAASEARIQTLTNRLMEKQETLEALRGRTTALEVRLSDAQSRAERAERRAAEMERSGGVPLALDLDGGDTLVRYASGGSTGLRRGKNRMAHALGRVAPVVQRSARMVTALDALDRWLLVLGRAFLGSPVARLALLAYVALLHAWVFVVLSFHTSHLKEEVQGAGGGGAAHVGCDTIPRFEATSLSSQLSRLAHAKHRQRTASSPSPASSAASSPLPSAARPRAALFDQDDALENATPYVAMTSEHTALSPSKTATASASASAAPVVSAAELAWLRRCLPVFVQPEVDVTNGNGLVKVFFRFERQADTGRLDCKLCVVFAGEASYNRVCEERENVLATFFYRTFNRRTYKRTADINYMEYRGVNLTPNAAVPWESIFSFDHGGEQRWAQGEKGDVCCWFSLMHHYRVDVAFNAWRLAQDARPLVFLNTCNHMIGERDNNPRLLKREWRDYACQEGDADDAFAYVVDHVPTKCNLYSLVCCWRARNGGGCCDRHPTGAVSRHGQSIYLPVDSKAATGDSNSSSSH